MDLINYNNNTRFFDCSDFASGIYNFYGTPLCSNHRRIRLVFLNKFTKILAHDRGYSNSWYPFTLTYLYNTYKILMNPTAKKQYDKALLKMYKSKTKRMPGYENLENTKEDVSKPIEDILKMIKITSDSVVNYSDKYAAYPPQNKKPYLDVLTLMLVKLVTLIYKALRISNFNISQDVAKQIDPAIDVLNSNFNAIFEHEKNYADKVVNEFETAKQNFHTQLGFSSLTFYFTMLAFSNKEYNCAMLTIIPLIIQIITTLMSHGTVENYKQKVLSVYPKRW